MRLHYLLPMMSQHATATIPPYTICGGKNYKGNDTCEDGWECKVINEWHHQCEPKDGTSPNPAPSPPVPSPDPGSCSPPGGMDFTNNPVNNSGFAFDHGKLSVDGVQLVDKDGKAVQLMGMSSHGLHWFPQCYSKESIKFLVENWGINVFRAAMYVGENGYATDPSVKDTVHNIVQWTKELGIYVMIDWHVLTPGNPSDPVYSGAAEFFREMASTYKDETHVIYELANEPNDQPNGPVRWNDLVPYYDEIIPIIREHTDGIIILGTPTWSQDIHTVTPMAYDNLMYAFHFYAASHETLYGNVEEYRKKIPLFVSEWGLSSATGGGNMDLVMGKKFLDLFADSDGQLISHAAWNYADKNEASSALMPGSCNSKAWDSVSCSGKFLRAYFQQNAKPPAEDPTDPPISDPEPDPTPDPIVDPTADPTPDPIADPTPEPSPAPAPVEPTTPSPIAGDPPIEEKQKQWEQCGGGNWNGPTTCYEGLICQGNQYHKQCEADPTRTCALAYDTERERCDFNSDCCEPFTCGQWKWCVP